MNFRLYVTEKRQLFEKVNALKKNIMKNLFPKIITAIFPYTFQKVYNCDHNHSRYKHLIGGYSY